MDQKVRMRLKQQVMDGLLEGNDVELPGVLVEDEIRNLQAMAAQQMGIDPTSTEHLPPRESFEEPARRRVKLGLLVAEVIRQAEIELDRGRVRDRIRQLAAGYSDPEEVIKLYTGNRQMMERLEMEIMEEQVVDWLLEHARIEEKAISFKELMNPE